MSGKIAGFFKDAMADMKENAKAQFEVDKANFAAAKAESKAQWDEAKAQSHPDAYKRTLQRQHAEQLAEAQQRIKDANAHIDAAKR